VRRRPRPAAGALPATPARGPCAVPGCGGLCAALEVGHDLPCLPWGAQAARRVHPGEPRDGSGQGPQRPHHGPWLLRDALAVRPVYRKLSRLRMAAASAAGSSVPVEMMPVRCCGRVAGGPRRCREPGGRAPCRGRWRGPRPWGRFIHSRVLPGSCVFVVLLLRIVISWESRNVRQRPGNRPR
jgi:hypothetical protein